jgi:hypothetical protein
MIILLIYLPLCELVREEVTWFDRCGVDQNPNSFFSIDLRNTL